MTPAILAHAYEFASHAHRDQRRRGNKEPYINHPLRVARTVAERKAGVEVIIAAVLHDVVEDTAVTIGEVVMLFGQPVGDLVQELTDPPSIENLPRKVRKRLQAEKFASASAGARMVKMADQIDNLESLLESLGTRKREDAISYATCALDVVEACAEADPVLATRARRVHDDILASLEEEPEPEPALA